MVQLRASLENALRSPITWGVFAGLVASILSGVVAFFVLRQRPKAAAVATTMATSPAAVE